ncbi:MAG: aminodeoxychorismate/anthranilate synthase component II [Actinobacteria bacterium]|nr:aminodeoxychorismate/anthranilate synthase component II [Actinomycetota bacterium]MCL5446548.1 aminodeoxychorismate/anthranilate synthase component II [Actinomycetota bacterium]
MVVPRILLIDNYDSFVYNLVQELGEFGVEPTVYRNDAVDVSTIRSIAPDALVISPGPGRPEDAGVSLQVITELAGEIPILGVCLGHQSIGVAFGAKVVRAGEIVHGKTSVISHNGNGILSSLPDPFEATRYHSLVIERGSIPPVLSVDAETADGTVMAVSHREMPIWGVQFHPESILSVEGPRLLQAFIDRI